MTSDQAGITAPPSAPAASPEATPPATIDESIYVEVVRRSIDAIILIDGTFKIRIWSPAAERLYGIAAETAVGQPLADLVVGFDAAGRPFDNRAARAELVTNGVWRSRLVHRP